MVWLAVKATMRKSVPGNKTARSAKREVAARLARGFTLIELMVVIAIIAIAAGVATLSLRDPAETQLQREAARLSALLEAARTEARSLGVAVVWAPVTEADMRNSAAGVPDASVQFRFRGLPAEQGLPSRWLNPSVIAEIPLARQIVLGPEPLIGAQRIVLRLDQQQITLDTDGLGPFIVQNQDASHRPASN